MNTLGHAITLRLKQIFHLETLEKQMAVDSNIPKTLENTPASSRRSSVYPTTSRRCSEAVAAYAATGDLEAVAEILKVVFSSWF